GGRGGRVGAAGGALRLQDRPSLREGAPRGADARGPRLALQAARRPRRAGARVGAPAGGGCGYPACGPATEVLGIETAGGRLRAVETTRGRIEAEQVVLASGAWSPGLAGTMGLS